MHPSVFSWSPLLLAAIGAGPAGAQSGPAPASPPAYRSAFEGYRPFSDQPIASWKDANDTVGRIGGWKAYAREASGETAPATTPPGPPDSGRAPAPVTSGRHGHHQH